MANTSTAIKVQKMVIENASLSQIIEKTKAPLDVIESALAVLHKRVDKLVRDKESEEMMDYEYSDNNLSYDDDYSDVYEELNINTQERFF